MDYKTILVTLFLALPPNYELCNPTNSSASTTAIPFLATTPLNVDTTTEAKSDTESTSVPSSTPSFKVTEIENESIESYEHIIVSGLPFQRGESHGRQAKAKIQKLISYYGQSASMPSWSDSIDLVQAHFMKALELHYPRGLEEMRGIASGANVTLEDIIILNARHELIQWKQLQRGIEKRETIEQSLYKIGECKKATETTADSSSVNLNSKSNSSLWIEKEMMVGIGTGAVALSSSTKYAHILLGQNWKAQHNIFKDDLAILLEVHPDPCEGIKPLVMLTEAGQLGLFGFNEDGLGVVGTNLWSSKDQFGAASREVAIPSLLLRRMFLESSTFTLGLQKVIKTPRFASTSLILATVLDEALNVELAPTDFFITKVPLDKEYIAQSNHFKSFRFMTQSEIYDKPQDISSFFRDRQVERRLANDWPRINEKTFQDAFKEDIGDDSCSRFDTNPKALSNLTLSTTASAILNLSQRTILVSKGPSCNGSYKYFKFEFSQL